MSTFFGKFSHIYADFSPAFLHLHVHTCDADFFDPFQLTSDDVILCIASAGDTGAAYDLGLKQKELENKLKWDNVSIKFCKSVNTGVFFWIQK